MGAELAIWIWGVLLGLTLRSMFAKPPAETVQHRLGAMIMVRTSAAITSLRFAPRCRSTQRLDFEVAGHHGSIILEVRGTECQPAQATTP